ncbi:MAG: hypothetical protein M3Z11_03070 [Candidatus Dormibacteraeota bacterium]|nr:hypothetical protein [Candidatus Dormibacteraeota bacterium]
MDLLASACLSLAIIGLGLGLVRRPQPPRALRSLFERQLARQRRRLEQARIPSRPQTLFAITVGVPAVLSAVGWLESPVLALVGLACGLATPRFYLAWLVHGRARRSEAEAPRFLQSVLTSLSAGSTYLDALRLARQMSTDPWIREDLDFVIQRFLLDVPMHVSMRELRTRVTTLNLGLVWETLIVCSANQLPTVAARTLFNELSGTVHFNTQLANEVRAKTAGQRLQIWLLAIIVPGMYLYLRLLSPDLLQSLDNTVMGRYVLIPAAVFLEVFGIYLSFRITRFEA